MRIFSNEMVNLKKDFFLAPLRKENIRNAFFLIYITTKIIGLNAYELPIHPNKTGGVRFSNFNILYSLFLCLVNAFLFNYHLQQLVFYYNMTNSVIVEFFARGFVFVGISIHIFAILCDIRNSKKIIQIINRLEEFDWQVIFLNLIGSQFFLLYVRWDKILKETLH